MLAFLPFEVARRGFSAAFLAKTSSLSARLQFLSEWRKASPCGFLFFVLWAGGFCRASSPTYVTSLQSWFYAACCFYGGGCKLSPGASEQPYGASGEVLQGSCSNAPGQLEKVYGPAGNVRHGYGGGSFQGIMWSVCPVYAARGGFFRCSFSAYSQAEGQLAQNNRVLRMMM